MENEPVNGIPVGSGSLTETDFALDYSNKVPGFDVFGYSVGAIYYSYPNIHLHPTAEAYGGLNVNVPFAPNPVVLRLRPSQRQLRPVRRRAHDREAP